MRTAPALGAALAIAVLGACTDEHPTRPADPPTDAAPYVDATGVAAAVEDARVRLIPSLSSTSRPDDLDGALGALLTAIADPEDIDAIPRSLDRARTAIADAGAEPGDAAQLAAIELVIDRAERILLGET